MRKVLEKHGYEVWARWDATADVYELFNDRDDGAYIGFAESLTEATKIGTWWVEEQQAEAKWNES